MYDSSNFGYKCKIKKADNVITPINELSLEQKYAIDKKIVNHKNDVNYKYMEENTEKLFEFLKRIHYYCLKIFQRI